MKKQLIATLAGSVLAALCAAPPVYASGPIGVCGGTPTNELQSCNIGWNRVPTVLPRGYTNWSGGAFTALDNQVTGLVNAGIQIVMLINQESYWSATPPDWNANSGGSGENASIDDFAQNFAVPLILHYQDLGVKVFEIWNEPNGSIQPSCYSAILTETYARLQYAGGHHADTVLVGGSMYGWGNVWGVYNSANAGADYLDSVYSWGINHGAWNYCKSRWGTYPLDAVSQHIYLDTTSPDYFTQAHFQNYIDYVRNVMNKYGDGYKRTYITEWGFESSCNSSDPCGQSNQDANMKTAMAAIYSRFNVLAAALWYRYEDCNDGESFGLTGPAPGYSRKTVWADYKDRAFLQGRWGLGNGDANIENYYSSHGGQPALGNPFDNGGSPWVHTWAGGGLSANVQDFNGGANQMLCIQEGPFGTFQINNLYGLWGYYLTHGGMSVFGPPKNDEYPSGSGTKQDFYNGSLTWDPVNGVLWAPAWLFNTSFDSQQPQPTWKDTQLSDVNVSGYHSTINPECSTRTEGVAHTGVTALMYSGTDNSTTKSYVYFKVFDVNIPITSSTKMSYWIYPQQDNGRYVGIDYHCSDGTNLRDSGAVDYNGFRMHPNAGHGGSIPLNSWTQIKCNVGQWLAGKTLTRIDVAYDRPPSTGQFRGYIDDVLITNGTLP